MSIWQGSNMIAGSGGGGIANYDGKSITKNANEEIQTVGVINSRDSSTAVKTWTGTKAQYDALVSGGTVDNNTLYNITDDTDISPSILETLYPVGSVYITTANTCPLSTLIAGSTWVVVSTGIVKAGDIPCKGNGMTLGLTDGTNNGGLFSTGASDGYTLFTNNYGDNIGSAWGSTTYATNVTLGITIDPSKSGIIADTTSLTLAVNIFERTA